MALMHDGCFLNRILLGNLCGGVPNCASSRFNTFWHWPIIVYYGDNVLLEFATFIVVIVSMSFMMTYYTFKANSLWPAAVFHAVSNVYIQKILPQLVQPREGAAHWMGEFGIMFALVTFVFGLYYWRKGMKAGL